MTREEAKRRIEICRDFLANNYSDMGEPNFTAFNMAIKALSSWEEYSDKLWKKAYERGKTEAMEVIKAHMDGEDKNTKAVLSDVMQSVNELEALSQEPCDDAVSREAVMGLVAREHTEWDDLYIDIAKLPSVTQKSEKWISVSERLPEDKTYVLTTIKVPNRIAHARSGWYEGGFFHNDNGDTWKATDMEVKAWMPLPEPYEPQESEIKNEKAN